VEQAKETPPGGPSRKPHSLRSLWQAGDSPVGLYVHVPFCRAICTYCAFAKGEYHALAADRWLELLEREIAARAASTWAGKPELDTLFLGGGTPSALTPSQWTRLGAILHHGFQLAPNIEFSTEANPESFTAETAVAMREIGINRVSLGVQSLDPGELKMLGRIHGVAEVEAAVHVARDAGFENLNLDLMYALPGQTLDVLKRTLEGVLALEPDHLSAYCLGLEPGTSLAGDVAGGSLPTPQDEIARTLYEHLVERSAGAGFAIYEISNFAQAGRACRHNLRYWKRDDVIGIGPSAHALLDNHRWVNPAPLEKWEGAYGDESGGVAGPPPRPVPHEVARFEWIFLNLRLVDGLSREEFAVRWGESFDEVYGVTTGQLIAGGMLEESGDRVHLTPSARFLSDAVFTEFAPG
jgi:oxygen-independent coproporphyrinogen-3 oxidase